MKRCKTCGKLVWPWQKKLYLRPTCEAVHKDGTWSKWKHIGSSHHHEKCFAGLVKETIETCQGPDNLVEMPQTLHLGSPDDLEWFRKKAGLKGKSHLGQEWFPLSITMGHRGRIWTMTDDEMQQRAAAILKRASRGEAEITHLEWQEHWYGLGLSGVPYKIQGWTFIFFDDAGDLDYTDSVFAPDGDVWLYREDYTHDPLNALTKQERHKLGQQLNLASKKANEIDFYAHEKEETS